MLAIVALEVPLGLSVRDRVSGEVRSQARGQADLVAASAAELLRSGQTTPLQELVDAAANATRGRVLVVDASGRVRADSAGRSTIGDNYGGRPELASALNGSPTQVERGSRTLGERLLATTTPVLLGRRTIGAARVTQSVAAVSRAVARAWVGLVLIGLLVLGLGLAAGALIARQVARPLRRLDRAAAMVAAGRLDVRARVEGSAEQRSLARTFNDMTARLAELLHAQGQFVADASHQLRTPLAGLRLRIEEAQATTRDDAGARQLGAALREIDRLAAMVGELLELSRAGERQAHGTAVSLGAAARAAGERWDPTAAERDQRIVVEADGAGRAWCDRADLDRILDVLVENALRYSPEGVEITIAGEPGALAVLDRGPGLSEGEDEDVFARFHRGSAGRAVPGGTGLGLATARALARAWAGEVTLANRTGGGARATVAIPAEAP